MPAFEPGRGLGPIARRIVGDHRFVGPFVLDMDEVVIGEPGVQERARETGGGDPPSDPILLDIGGVRASLLKRGRRSNRSSRQLNRERVASRRPITVSRG